MGTEPDHIACANRTQETIKHLLQDAHLHSPWIATAAFYKALHVVEAVFSNDPKIQDTSNHDERDFILSTHRKFEQIYKNYSPLKRASMNARYLPSGITCFEKYLSPEAVIDRLLKGYLDQVEKYSRQFLRKPKELASILELFGEPKK